MSPSREDFRVRISLHGYTQAKLTYNDIMLRAFFSGNNSSDDDLGYFLNNGLVVFDDSRVYGFQAQQSKNLSSRQSFTYGSRCLVYPAGDRRNFPRAERKR